MNIASRLRVGLLPTLVPLTLFLVLPWGNPLRGDVVIEEDDWDLYGELVKEPGDGDQLPEIVTTEDGVKSLHLPEPDTELFVTYWINVTQLPGGGPGPERFTITGEIRNAAGNSSMGIRNLTVAPIDPGLSFPQNIARQASFAVVGIFADLGGNVKALGSGPQPFDPCADPLDEDPTIIVENWGDVGEGNALVPTAGTVGIFETVNVMVDLVLGMNEIRIDATDVRDLPCTYDAESGHQVFSLTFGPGVADLQGEVVPVCGVSRSLSSSRFVLGGTVAVTLTARNLTGATTITETFPDGWTVSNAGGGTVSGNTVAFNLTADGEVTYELTADGACQDVSLSGTIMGADACAGDVAGDSDLRCTTSVYENEVLNDEPVAYWRLGEDDPLLPAENIGSGFDINGTYTGAVLVEEEGLIFDDPDTAVGFDGFGAEVQIPDSDLINDGGPYQAKTIELWFQAEVIGPEAGMLYQQGGTSRGLSMYVQEVDGEQLLFMNGWNRAEEQWEPVWVSTEIEEGVTYHAVMVLDASENDVFGDFDGRITGYLDGEEFETAEGADQLYGHGNNISIGSVENNTFFPDGSNPTNGAYFTGIIDEVAVYNSLLDDPDDDGDFSDSRVLDHFLAGSKGGGPERPQFRRGDGANVGSVNITSAINLLNFLFSDTVNSLACHEAGDVNNDGDVNITDPVGLLNHLFGDGSPPKAPGLESCGPDPDEPGSPGDLGCEEYTSC